MYNDYQVVYESNINQNFIYYVIFGLILLAIIIFTFISLSKVFKKANRSVISAWIPIYNVITLLEIINLPKWYFILMLVPILNLYILWKISVTLAYSFKRKNVFGLGLMFLPFIYYPILAFSDSEYIGINLIAKEGTTTVADIPIIDNKEDMDLTIHEEQDTASRNINISIGGGVYQKDYTKDLLQADDKQTIKTKPNLIDSKVRDTTNNSFIKVIPEEVKEEPKKEETVAFEMPNILENNNVIKRQRINPIPTIDVIDSSNDKQNEQVQPINNVSSNEQEIKKEVSLDTNSEYINCPKCGAKLKNGTSVCFLCGTHLQ